MSNKPTAVNIGIGFDISELRKSSAAGRAEINSFISDAKKARTDLEKYKSSMATARSLFKAGDINAATLAKMDAYYKKLHNIRTEFQRIGDASKKAFSSLPGMLGAVGVGFSAAHIVSASAKLAMERERMQNMFSALTGSDATAGSMMRNFVRLDRESPLSFMDIGRGAQTMMGFGMSQELLMPSLKALSEISMGNSERFQSLSLALGQVAAAGKLAGQEVLQMVNAGFNPLQEISRRTGVSMAQLKLDMEAGRVSFVQVVDAIMSSIEPGGRFHGMSEKILDTLSGQIDKVRSDFQLMSAEFGTSIIPTIRMFVETLVNNKDAVRQASSAFTQFFDSIGYLIAMMSDLKGSNWSPFFLAYTGENTLKFDQAMAERNADNNYFALKAKEEAAQGDDFMLKPELKAEMLAKEQRQRDALQLTKEIATLQERMQNEYNKKLGDERELLRENLGLNRANLTLEQTAAALKTLWMYDEIQARDRLKEQQREEETARKEALKDQMELVRAKQQQADAIGNVIENADEELKVQRELWDLFDAVDAGLDPAKANKAGIDAVKKLIDGPSTQGPRALTSRADVMLAAQQANRQIAAQQRAQEKFNQMTEFLRNIRDAMKNGPVIGVRR
jgi:tape measure domain-containing protein